jgi:hypothetical protein
VNIKYGLLSFKKSLELNIPFEIDANTYLIAKNATQLFDESKTEHWQNWIGKLRWDELQSDNLALVTWMPTIQPEDFDKENRELTNRMSSAWHALLLGRGKPTFAGKVNMLIGSGTLEEGR